MFEVKQGTNRAGAFKRAVTGVAIGLSAITAGCGATTKRVDPNKDNPVASGANLNTFDRKAVIDGAVADLEKRNIFSDALRKELGLNPGEKINLIIGALQNNTSTILGPGVITNGIGDTLQRASQGVDYRTPPQVKEGEPAQDTSVRAMELEGKFAVRIIDRSSQTLAMIQAERKGRSDGAVEGENKAGLAGAQLVLCGEIDSMEFTGNETTNRGFFVRPRIVNLTTGVVYWTFERSTAFESTQNMLSR